MRSRLFLPGLTPKTSLAPSSTPRALATCWAYSRKAESASVRATFLAATAHWFRVRLQVVDL